MAAGVAASEVRDKAAVTSGRVGSTESCQEKTFLMSVNDVMAGLLGLRRS